MKCWPPNETARDISGRQLIKALCRDWEYHQIHQVGSHVILETNNPFHQRISIPNHNPLRIGTFNGILRTVARHKNTTRQKILQPID